MDRGDLQERADDIRTKYLGGAPDPSIGQVEAILLLTEVIRNELRTIAQTIATSAVSLKKSGD